MLTLIFNSPVTEPPVTPPVTEPSATSPVTEPSATTVEVLVDVFPAQSDGFSVYYGGSVHHLFVVAESDALSGMGGVLKIHRNGITYAIYLVDVTDPAASHLRIKTATAIKAIRLKT